jgi:hypothetical protein
MDDIEKFYNAFSPALKKPKKKEVAIPAPIVNVPAPIVNIDNSALELFLSLW